MDTTRIISLTRSGVPRLALLGGEYYLNSDVGGATSRVWELQWNRTSQSYYWDDGLDPPMGELHLLYYYSYSLQGVCLLMAPQ